MIATSFPIQVSCNSGSPTVWAPTCASAIYGLFSALTDLAVIAAYVRLLASASRKLCQRFVDPTLFALSQLHSFLWSAIISGGRPFPPEPRRAFGSFLGLLTDWGLDTRCFFGLWADLVPPAELGPVAPHQE